MESLQEQVRKSFRSEMLATGLYAVLAEQYGKKKPQMGKIFKEASDQEYMHGKLFRQFSLKRFGTPPGNETLWIACGRFAARMMTPFPLKKKLKTLCSKEFEAVVTIGKALSGDPDPGFRKILTRILPDEEAHAAIYKKLFPGL